MCFQNRSRGPLLEVPIFIGKLDFGTIFDLLFFQKTTFWITFPAQKSTFRYLAEVLEPSLSRPCFSRNHSGYRAVGTYCSF